MSRTKNRTLVRRALEYCLEYDLADGYAQIMRPRHIDGYYDKEVQLAERIVEKAFEMAESQEGTE